MSTATLADPAAEPRRADLFGLLEFVRPGHRLLITGVSWDEYERFLAWRDEHRPASVRLAYDDGSLELMVVSNLHERWRKVLALLIEAWIAETGGDYVPSGQLTHRREDLARGFEPDECYYVQNWKAVAGLREIDFTVDPPPDLMVEIEATRSIIERLPIMAAFRVPEVWRYDGGRIAVLLLGSDGQYRESAISRAIPDFPFAEVPKFVEMSASAEISSATNYRRFREWVRTTRPPAG